MNDDATDPTRLLSDRPLRGLVRVTLCVMAVSAALVLLWLGWAGYAAHQLAVALADVRRRGEPLAVDDPRLLPPPPARAAAETWDAAFKRAVGIPAHLRGAGMLGVIELNGWDDAPSHPDRPLSPDWHVLADGSSTTNAAAIAAADRAADGSWAGWPVGVDVADRSARLLTCLEVEAVRLHVKGDDVGALRRLRTVSRLARLSTSRVCWDGSAATLFALAPHPSPLAAYDTVAYVALTLDAPPHSAARAATATLIVDLLNRPGFDPEALAARESLVQDVVAFDAARVGTGFLWPMVTAAEVRAIHLDEACVAAAAQPDWPAAAAVYRAAGGPIDDAANNVSASPTTKFLANRGSLDWPRWIADYRLVQDEFNARACERLAATSLAVRLYRVDHGRWPGQLGDLVPDYLPAVPIDPLLADGRPVGYVVASHGLPDGGDRPLLTAGVAATDVRPPREPRYGVFASFTSPLYLDVALWTAR